MGDDGVSRPNRARRRELKDRYRSQQVRAGRRMASGYVGILPGLPGSAFPWVPVADLEAARAARLEEAVEAVRVMHPGMVQRARDVARLGLSGRAPRLRHARESAPGGLGKGVLLGEFTAKPARSELVLPEKTTPAGLILP